MSLALDEVQRAVRAFVLGVMDSLSVHSFLIFMLTSPTVRSRAFRYDGLGWACVACLTHGWPSCARARTGSCFALNGVIFLGSIYLHSHVVKPLVAMLLVGAGGPTSEELAMVGGYVGNFLNMLQYVLWLGPIYGISFVFNIIWYQDIADSAYAIRGQKPVRADPSWKRILDSLSQLVYRLFLSQIFLVQAYFCYLVPLVGSWLATLHFSWLYALQAFDYKWSLERWPPERSLVYFERRFAYMAGFGFPAALISLAYPGFVSLGLYALSFPVFIILAIIAKPVAHLQGTDAEEAAEMRLDGVAPPSLPGRLPVFKYAKIVAAAVLKRLYKRKPQM